MLNVGVLVAASTLFASEDIPRPLVAVLFVIGAVFAVLAALANKVQHSYYHAARDLKTKLEKRMALEDLAIATTPGMGSPIDRIGAVRSFLKIMLIAIALVDLGGAGFAIADTVKATEADRQPPRSVLIHLPAKQQVWSVLVVSRDGAPVESRDLKRATGPLLLELRPGKYLVSLGGRTLCQRWITVGRAPLQMISLRC